MAEFLNDTFTAANDTFLPDHDANWEEMAWGTSQADTANRPVIFDNRMSPAAVASAETRAVRWNVDPGADEYRVTASWTFRFPAQSGRHNAIYVRMSDTGTAHSAVDYYRIRGSSSSNELEIAKNVSGTFTVLTTVPFEFATADSGGPYMVRVETLTTGITVFIDDVEVASTTDTEITQRGRVGLGTRRRDGSEAHGIDSIVAETIVDTPTADASTPTPTVSAGTTGVQLNGSASGGAGGPYTYAWTQTAGTTVTLSDPTAQNPTFDAPAGSTVLTFQLVVTDTADVDSPPDPVSVTVLGSDNSSVPVTDEEVTGWTSEPDDAPTLASTLANSSNADYIISPENPVDAQAEFGLSPLAQPQPGDQIRMNYRARIVDGTSGSVTVYLMDGITQIAERTHEITEPAGTFQPFEDELTEQEIAAITAPDALSVIIEVTAS